jgi:hypothetical protein
VQMMSNSIIFFRLRSAIICNQHFMAKGIWNLQQSCWAVYILELRDI